MHEAIYWPEAMETALWPMAADYATYHHNHMPDPHTGMILPWIWFSKFKQLGPISQICMFGVTEFCFGSCTTRWVQAP